MDGNPTRPAGESHLSEYVFLGTWTFNAVDANDVINVGSHELQAFPINAHAVDSKRLEQFVGFLLSL